MPRPKDGPRFEGFTSPQFTQVPNIAFDDLMADCSGAEWKVLCYIMRRTYGWHKDTDTISIPQLTNGINGRDRGTGLSKSTVAVALNSLEEWGLIVRHLNEDAAGGSLPTTYGVRFSSTQESENRTPSASNIGPPGVQESDPQKKHLQNKEKKDDPSLVQLETDDIFAARLRQLRRKFTGNAAAWQRLLDSATPGDPSALLARIERAVYEAQVGRR